MSIKLAKRVCADCPVKACCRDYAVAAAEFGVWGGLTPAERDELRGAKFIPLDVRERSELAERMLDAGHTKEQVAETLNVDVRTVYRFAAAKRAHVLRQADAIKPVSSRSRRGGRAA